MKIRRLHRISGIIMTLPFFGWAITGFIFFIKPGYSDAYEVLEIKTYPIRENISLQTDSTWVEFRYLKTILGNHLLTRTTDNWSHLEPETLQPKTPPTEKQIRQLLSDSFTSNPERYGTILNIDVENRLATTDTGVRVSLNWNRLSLYQRGNDTDRIDMFYKIHYLQWTGISLIDKVLGMLGLLLISTLTVLGIRLFFASEKSE